jgi:Flp pilus assembly protein protease CpaA
MHLGPSEIVLFVGLLIASATDLAWGKIPNVLTFPLMALGVAMALGTSTPFAGALGCAAGFALHFPLFAAGIEKGGDAKLMMALGALLGWHAMIEATIWLAVLYLPIGLVILAARGKLGNLVASARYAAAKASGNPDPGPPPETTWFVTGPVIAVAGVLTCTTDWFAVLI